MSLDQPWAGLRTFVAHTFHVLNYTLPFTHTYAKTPWPAAPANAVNQATSISTPERRYALVVFCLAGPLGLWQISRWWTAHRRLPIALAVALGVAIAVGSAIWLPRIERVRVLIEG